MEERLRSLLPGQKVELVNPAGEVVETLVVREAHGKAIRTDRGTFTKKTGKPFNRQPHLAGHHIRPAQC